MVWILYPRRDSFNEASFDQTPQTSWYAILLARSKNRRSPRDLQRKNNEVENDGWEILIRGHGGK